MILKNEQVEFIQEDLKRKGVTSEELLDSLVDHICCFIEDHEHSDFDQAYSESMAQFGDFGPKEIQKRTTFLLNLKSELNMKIAMYLLGYLAAILTTTGLLFKVMHWPSASIQLVLGIAILNFGFLPVYFITNYRRSISG